MHKPEPNMFKTLLIIPPKLIFDTLWAQACRCTDINYFDTFLSGRYNLATLQKN